MLARLERIETLDRAQAEPGVLLDELRELVREVEIWAKRERDPRAEAAAELLAEQCSGEPSKLRLGWEALPRKREAPSNPPHLASR